MGDRNNPIKFGPEWLRNLPREQSAGRPQAGQSSARPAHAGTSSRAAPSAPLLPSEGAAGPSVPSTSFGPTKGNNNSKPVLKVRLAKLRYGREEMLALYDRTTEAPEELKFFDLLYQPRGKPPFALNTFEEEARDLRGGPTAGAMSGDRFGASRSTGRAAPGGDPRRGPRGSFLRHPPGQNSVRGSTPMHASGGRAPAYGSPADDEPSSSRSWSANNGGAAPARGDSSDWIGTRTYRRRHNHTNWRQTSRDDGDEWRHSETQGRSYGRSNSDKWADRDWSEGERRPQSERPQPWSVARRAWLGVDSHHHNTEEAALPEWAVNTPEAGAGTFDSSGAFHGYSKDESNIPKTQESTYPLTRSHTHGSFGGSKALEEGSDEWWASEKAKKLSPKRFDMGEIKNNKPTSTITSEPKPSIRKLSRDEGVPAIESSSDAQENVSNNEQTNESTSSTEENQQSALQHNFSENQTFDAMMRPDVGFVEPPEETRGNFQSVMINPSNGLRQKHQNIVTSLETSRPPPNVFQRLHSGMPLSAPITDHDHLNSIEKKIIDDMVEMNLYDTSVPPPNIHVPPPNLRPPQPAVNPPLAPPVACANHGLQMSMQNPAGLQPTLLAPTHPPCTMQTVAIQNQALNSALGLPVGTAPRSNLMMPMQGSLPPTMQSTQRNPMASDALRSRPLLGGFQPVVAPTIPNNSLFMSHTTPPPMQTATEMRMPGHEAPGSLFPPIGVQRPAMEDPMDTLYSTMRPQMRSTDAASPVNLWYYEDPTNEVQGPFSCKQMDYWFKMGFFGPSMMVRRACEAAMRPLVSYGPTPFAFPIDMQPYQMSTYEAHSQAARELVEQQRRVSIDVLRDAHVVNPNMASSFPPPQAPQYPHRFMVANNNITVNLPPEQLPPPPAPPRNTRRLTVQYQPNAVNVHPPPENFLPVQAPMNCPRQLMERQLISTVTNHADSNALPNTSEPIPYGIQQGPSMQPLEALWAQPGSSQTFSWSPRRTDDRDEDIVNNLPMYFWDQQPNSSSMTLPAGIVKDMKTEDEILAQLRAANTVPTPPIAPFLSDSALNTSSNSTSGSSSDDTFSIVTSPDLEKLQQLIESERLLRRDFKSDSDDSEAKSDKTDKIEPIEEATVVKTPPAQNKIASEPKLAKRVKNETEKPTKGKDNGNKAKTKKNKVEKKEEKKEDAEIKTKQEEIKPEKAILETSSTKNKKEEKQSKKELEKEKKGWIKEGFTIVKGTIKSVNKESKKKVEEVKIVEEVEKKGKEDEKFALEEEKKKKQLNLSKKQQQEQQRLLTESMVRRAPWSAGSLGPGTARAGLPLSEIQRLEREKKLEQVKEQQHMMHLIAQQQAAALAREQEMQANLAWAKNHLDNNGTGPTLAEIQAETRRQSAAAAVAAQSIEEVIPLPPLQTGLTPTPLPWGGTPNAGFWDMQPSVPKQEKPQEPPKSSECKTKKKVALTINPRREPSPNTEFEVWCSTVLALWRSKVDVPTFVGFLKDIESPYEVKDYVRYYLGDSKDANDFARQFLEKRSKLLRAGTVTPSDDLCSPAVAVNPRAALTDYQEVKGKGKKSKKNKMLKVDVRILGFSVTAAEDRINVGDIDTV